MAADLTKTTVEDEARRTLSLLRPLNKALAVARTRAEKNAIEAQMADIKAAWFRSIASEMATIHAGMTALHDAARRKASE